MNIKKIFFSIFVLSMTLLTLQPGQTFSSKKGVAELLTAAKTGDIETATFLIDHGVDPAATEEGISGWNALHFACKYGYPQLAELILKKRPTLVNVSENYNNRTPLHLATRNGHYFTTRLLLVNGAKINSKDKQGWTPLHFACHQGHIPMIKLLLNHKADIEAKNVYKWTPLHTAAEKDVPEVVDLLLTAGADVNAQSETYEYTPLHIACANHRTRNAMFLVCNGAYMHKTNAHGHTPLDLTNDRVLKKSIALALAIMLQKSNDIELLVKELDQLKPLTDDDFDFFIKLAQKHRKPKSHEELLWLKKRYVGLTANDLQDAPSSFGFKYKMLYKIEDDVATKSK